MTNSHSYTKIIIERELLATKLAACGHGNLEQTTSSITSLTDSLIIFINLSSSTPQSRISWIGTSPTSVNTRGSFNSLPTQT